MTKVLVAIAILVVLAISVLFIIRLRSPYEQTKTRLRGVEPGPIRHQQLPKDLVDRIMVIRDAVSEVYSVTDEEWLDGFQRDLNPENEVLIWESISDAYTRFTSGRDLTKEQKNEAFGLLLLRSSTTDMEPTFENLKVLTRDQAKKVISFYRANAQPVTVTKKPNG